MTDIETAVRALDGHSIALVRNGEVITHDGRGISPMLTLIGSGTDLRGYSAADIIVGKAAAMLFVKAGIAAVYARTVSRMGLDYLNAHGIPCDYDTLTDNIINREGTDICPMEKTVLNVDDYEMGYALLLEKRRSLMAKAHSE